MTQFASTGIQGVVLDTIRRRSITEPTPIQAKAIPVALTGGDLIGIAQTGTGKTLAFVLPILQRLKQLGGKVLIVLPTRELAFQVNEVCRWFEQSQRVSSTVVVGGASMQQQITSLRRRPDFIIATPGRLLDHLRQRTVDLSYIKYLVLDEADRMFDMGFMPQIRAILEHLPPPAQRQTLLFSATMPEAIAAVVKKYMHTPVSVQIAPTGSTASGVQQGMIIIDKQHQQQALLQVLEKTHDAVLIFTRTKHRAKSLTRVLRAKGYKAEELHSNRSLAQRKQAVAAIQSRRSQILVATDIAARGIDISHLNLVINYDLPDQPEDYIHRIGRTGRAGRKGKALSFVISDQGQQLRSIQKLIDVQIQQVHLDTIPTAQLQYSTTGLPARQRHYGRNRRRFSQPRRRR